MLQSVMVLINKITTAFLFWFCACATVVFFFIVPAVSNIYKIGTEITDQKKIIKESEERAVQLESFKDFSKKEEENFAKTEKLFVDPQMPLDFIGFLELSAKNAGVFLEITPNTVIEKDKKHAWPFLNFRLSLTGDFNDIVKFIKSVESGNYLVSVPSVSIVSDFPKKSSAAKLQNEKIPEQKAPNVVIMLTAYAKNEKK